MSKFRVNWHKGIISAIQIDLRDYSHILDYKPEFFLSPNKNRIDLLIIKKLTDEHIPISIASIFKEINLFEFKGFYSTLTTDAYYKLHGHAGYYIDSTGKTDEYSRNDVTLSLFSFKHPKKLFKHLTKDCRKTIEKIYSGIYYIGDDMYSTQVIVGKELSPKDMLYLACLTSDKIDAASVSRLETDCITHNTEEIYVNYIDQLTNSHNSKGVSTMVSENLLRLYGTSSKEIEERTKAIYEPQLQALQNHIHILEQRLLENNLPTD